MSAGPPAFFATEVKGARRFYRDLAPDPRAQLVVVCGGREECTPAYRIQRRGFPFWSLEYVVAGRGRVHLEGRWRDLGPGDVFSYGPGVPHEIVTSGDAPLVKYFVDVAGRHARRRLQQWGLWPPRLARVHPPDALQRLFEELIDAGLRSGPGGDALCAGLFGCLGIKLRMAAAPAEQMLTPAFLTYQRCCALIQSDPAKFRNLADVARACHVDRAHLCRLFRRFSGETPYRYLMRQKLAGAAARLCEPGALVKAVAWEAGFSDPFHFSRVFKRVFGVSPSVFRLWRCGREG
ncbi:AraC family transcriptional regulator [Limisphaera sp. VF-2]|uniref:AraC family transcriptional regulator n=1 Tax=Limisphaera sp. VF-2 TaxID=3400418 RepID=UPI003C225670